MTAEDRVKMQIGQLVVGQCIRDAEIEQLKSELEKLKRLQEQQDDNAAGSS